MTINSSTLDYRDRRIARVLRLIAHDLAERPTLAEAASIAGLEQTYFSRYFQKVVGLGFVVWNGRIRAEKAKLLLEDLHVPISEVAAAVGYSNVTTFARNFRRYALVSPRQYRQQLQRSGTRKQDTKNAENSTRNAETFAEVLPQTQLSTTRKID